MWKKDKQKDQGRRAEPDFAGEPAPRAPTSKPSGAPPERATIGGFIRIRGEVTGEQDLLIEGRVDGMVDLGHHALTIGPEGEVKADIAGRVVMVEGLVEGNLRAKEQVILRSSARVHGDITAPSVIVEDGAHFRGGVDMDGGNDEGAHSDDAGAGESEDSSGPARATDPSGKGDRSDSVASPAPSTL